MENTYLKEANVCVTLSPLVTHGDQQQVLLVTYKVYEVNNFLPSFGCCELPCFAEWAGKVRVYNGSCFYEHGGAMRHERKHIKVSFKVDREYQEQFDKWIDTYITTQYERHSRDVKERDTGTQRVASGIAVSN